MKIKRKTLTPSGPTTLSDFVRSSEASTGLFYTYLLPCWSNISISGYKFRQRFFFFLLAFISWWQLHAGTWRYLMEVFLVRIFHTDLIKGFAAITIYSSLLLKRSKATISFSCMVVILCVITHSCRIMVLAIICHLQGSVWLRRAIFLPLFGAFTVSSILLRSGDSSARVVSGWVHSGWLCS